MGLFKDILGAEESLFKNEEALDFEWVPKLMPYRDQQQRYVASAIKPLFQDRNGKNLLIYGAPGIGKTAAIKWVIRDLEEETDDIIPVYINCWQKNTTYKIILEMCEQLGYRFTQNKRTEELFKVLKENILKNKAAVFAFDEIDKAEDLDFIYTLIEEFYKKSILLITNYKEWLMSLDERIKSRLVPEMLEFQQYNHAETAGILKQRVEYAFVPGVWEDDAFNLVVDKTAELKDIRSGLYLLKESGSIAENSASRKIKLEHAKQAVLKLSELSIKKSTDLEEDTQLVLAVCKEGSGKKIGDLFKTYKEKNGKNTYKTFQRKIEKLEKNKFISVHKTAGGKEGNTSIIDYNGNKKLTEF